MSRTADHVVVGAGVAGLTAAAYLARAGKRPLVLERSDRTGGLVQTFWHEGFAFDAGVRALESAGIIFPMLRQLGLSMDVVPSPVSIRVGDERVRWTSKESLAAYGDMLKRQFSESSDDVDRIIAVIGKVMVDLDVIYGIDNPLFADDMKDPRYLKDTLLPWFIDYRKSARTIRAMTAPVEAFLAGMTSNQALIDMITQHFFEGTPAFFALSYFGLYLDYVYPVGGTGTLPALLTDFIGTHGGEIRTNAAVASVDAERHVLTLEDGDTITYGRLIWAADQQAFYRMLSGRHSRKAERQRALVVSCHAADSVLTVFMGTTMDHAYCRERFGPHAFETPATEGVHSIGDWRAAEDLWAWIDRYLARTTYEISCPALRDPTLAPAGQTGIIVSTLFDYELVRTMRERGMYDALKARCTDKILSVLGAMYPELAERVRFTLCSTPWTIERMTGNTEGGLNGWSFTNSVMPAEHRFTKMQKSVRHPIAGIVQCGQWTFSPAGIPTCILTGKLAADRVLKN
jgi:phytoene dehydrogenase-like protein